MSARHTKIARDGSMVEALLSAYRRGMFPMADTLSGLIRWYSPDPRAVIPIAQPAGAPGGLHLGRSLRARVRRAPFTITSDSAFARVIRACAARRPGQTRGETWIDDRIIEAYIALHQAGHAHSVEAWTPAAEGQRPRLVGGLYGVHIGSAFFGESMFCRPERGGTDASKVCLVHLVHHLRERGFILLDTQFSNPHMDRFGIVEIPRQDYLNRLEEAIEKPAAWSPWTTTPPLG